MRQVVPDVYLIEGLRASHVYVLVSEGGLTLVDSGSPGEATRIESHQQYYEPEVVRPVSF